MIQSADEKAAQVTDKFSDVALTPPNAEAAPLPTKQKGKRKKPA
jgi:hypothetical protein